MAITSYIGATVAIAVAQPATEDQTGYEALSWTVVENVKSVGEFGDQAEDISFNLLASGRTSHVNGAKDIGDIPIAFALDPLSNTGISIVETNSAGNTVCSIRITDTDGTDFYMYGFVASYRQNERNTSVEQGGTFIFRPQSGITKV